MIGTVHAIKIEIKRRGPRAAQWPSAVSQPQNGCPRRRPAGWANARPFAQPAEYGACHAQPHLSRMRRQMF